MEKKVVAVVGSTGLQGGSVVDYLLKSGEFKVRGLTRNTKSTKAKELTSRGVEMVEADLNDKLSLEKAFYGAWGVFGVTNFWDPDIFPNNMDKERKQGFLMAQVAKEQGVSLFVYSSVYDAHKLSGGKFQIPHFRMKAEIEEYARSLATDSFKVAFYCPGFYSSNFFTLFRPKQTEEGWKLIMPVKPSAKFAMIDITDTGKMVVEIFRNPEQWVGKRILGAAEELNLEQVASAMSKVSGVPVKYQQISYEDAKLIKEVEENLKWIEEYGYYNGDSLDETRKKFPNLTKFEDFLKKVNYHPAKEIETK